MEKHLIKPVPPSNADIVESNNIVHFSDENVRNRSSMYCSLDKSILRDIPTKNDRAILLPGEGINAILFNLAG